MKAVSTKLIDYSEEGKRRIEAVIVASETPAALPTDGSTVTGMSADEVFAPLSILYVTDPTADHQIYIADESGQFIAQ